MPQAYSPYGAKSYCDKKSACQKLFFVDREHRINELITIQMVEEGLNNQAQSNLESFIQGIKNVLIRVSQ